MQTKQATKKDLAAWRETYAAYRPRLNPNRISGAELYAYLQSHYPLALLEDPRAKQVVIDNILQNECFFRELPQGTAPQPVCCIVSRAGNGIRLYDAQDEVFSGCDIFVGIDLVSGYFLVEGSSLLWDELYAQRGLNDSDLENVYSVAEYIRSLSRFGLLEDTLKR